MPVSDCDYKLMQIHFIGITTDETDQRSANNSSVRRYIIEQFQTLFHQRNQLITLFKTALGLTPSNNHKIVIGADTRPVGQFAKVFNTPTNDEVVIVIVG